MLKLSSVLIDALAEVGGQCTALYPEKPIYDIPAHPAIEAGELVAQLERADRAVPPGPRCSGRRVERLEGAAGAFTLGTDHGDVVRCKAVIAGRRRRRLRPQPAAAGRAGGVRGHRRGAILRAPARGFARQAGGDRRRRRFGGGLGAGAARHRRRRSRWCTGAAKFRAAPESAAQLDHAAGARRGRAGDPLPAARAARRRRGAGGGGGGRPGRRHAACWRPMCCCRSSACRWISARSPAGAWRWSATM